MVAMETSTENNHSPAPVPFKKIAWTPERVQCLTKLWSEGYSASQIAQHLGGGMTRNAVIGKVHRLGISARSPKEKPQNTPNPPPHQTLDKEERKKKPLQNATVTPLPLRKEPSQEPNQPCSLLELTDKTCRWPVGESNQGAFQFCGCLPTDSSPYCPTHTRQAFQTSHARKALKRYG